MPTIGIPGDTPPDGIFLSDSVRRCWRQRPPSTTVAYDLGRIDIDRPRRAVAADRWIRRQPDDQTLTNTLIDRIRAIVAAEQDRHLRPVFSNGAASGTNAGTGVSWNAPITAGLTSYVIVGGLEADVVNAQTESCTLDGVAMTPLFRWALNAGINERSWYVFSITPETTGTGAFVFTSTISTTWEGISFSCANGPVDGSIIMPAAYGAIGTTSLVKKAFGWDPDGRLVAVSMGTISTIAEGTQIANGTMLFASGINAANTAHTVSGSRVGSGTLALLTFLVPSRSQQLSGGAFQPLWTTRTDVSSLAQGGSIAVGLPYGGSGSGERRAGTLLNPGTFKSIAFKANKAPGGGKAVTLELMRGASTNNLGFMGLSFQIPTGITLTISGSETEASIDAVDLPFYRYEQFAWRYTNTGTGALPTDFHVSAVPLVEWGVARELVYGGGDMAFASDEVDEKFSRAPLHPDRDWNWRDNTASNKSLFGIACDITEYIVHYQEDIDSAGVFDFYLEVDGVTQASTHAQFVADTTGQAMARWRGTLRVPRKSFVSVIGYNRVGGVTIRMAATIKVRTLRAGDVIISGHSTYSSSSGVDRVALPNASREEYSSTVANELALALVIPPMTAANDTFHVRGMVEKLEPSGPGTGSSWVSKLRHELADSSMPDLVISDSEVWGETEGDVEFASGEHLSRYWDAVSLPDATRQYWSMPGYITPPGPATGGVIGPHIFYFHNRTQPEEAT